MAGAAAAGVVGPPRPLVTLDGMTSHQNTQTMKPATAAKKLGVYLEATPPTSGRVWSHGPS